MSESFVDLSYRGLPLGRRIKLTQVRPTTGYLELPMPMPVGTPIAIATDEGVTIDALVTQIHEQVGGSDRVPGMTIKPTLGDAAATWWKARVVLPEAEPPPPARARPVTVRPRTQTIQTPPPPPPPEEDKKTVIMEAVELPPELIEELPPEALRSTGEHPVLDDGKRTVMMDAVDPAALGLETDDGDEDEPKADDKPPERPSSATVKRRKKRR